MIRILDTPKQWIPKNTFSYPPHQGLNPLIEERAFSYFTTMDIESDYIYIPIQWTQYHCSQNWGNDKQKVAEIQNWCNQVTSQYPNEKFFTVVQYDDGTLVSIDNCTIFASSNSPKSPIGLNSKYIPIPLLSDPHVGSQKDVKSCKVGYAGRNDTHSMRKVVIDKLQGLPDYKFAVNLNHGLTEAFRNIIYDSIFGLAPRGYGPTSFRLYETMQMGAIPIYISDVFWLPFEDVIEWDKAVVLIKENEIDSIPNIVDSLIESNEYINYLEYGKLIYNNYLTWDGTLNQIAKFISKK